MNTTPVCQLTKQLCRPLCDLGPVPHVFFRSAQASPRRKTPPNNVPGVSLICLLAMLMLVNGCARGIRDHTADQVHADLLQTCFETKKASFIYEARCADLTVGGFGGSTFCKGIQAFAPLPNKRGYNYQYPNSWEEYTEDRAKWDASLFIRLMFEEQRTILAPIPIGTRLYITGIYEYPRGSTGHIMIARATLSNGEFEGTEVELDAGEGFSDTGPNWIGPPFYPNSLEQEKIEVSEEFLSLCKTASS